MHDNGCLIGLARSPRAVHFGARQRYVLTSCVKELGTSTLIVTDPRLANDAGFLELVDLLRADGTTVTVFGDVEAELPTPGIEACVASLAGKSFDSVVGIGGGSCIDMAKVVSVLLTHGGRVADYFGEFRVPGPVIPIIAVPTTAGTGSEVTAVSVVADAESGLKVGVSSPFIVPYFAICDPELTVTAPPGLTAATGADALTHLVEAFTAKRKPFEPQSSREQVFIGKNEITDTYARAGLGLLNRNLAVVVENPSDLDARSGVMLGALYGGYSIATAGVTIAHALQYPVGAITHTAHGLGVGVLLPYTMRFNLPEREAEFAELATVFGVANAHDSTLENAQAAIGRVDEILRTLGIPSSLADLGISSSHVDEIVDATLGIRRIVANNPREFEAEDARVLVRRAIDGDRGWW
jgi:alcohol dehydrogenase